MSQPTITPEQFAKVCKLLGIAQGELQSLYRTEQMITKLFPLKDFPDRAPHINAAIFARMTPKQLLKQLRAKVK